MILSLNMKLSLNIVFILIRQVFLFALPCKTIQMMIQIGGMESSSAHVLSPGESTQDSENTGYEFIRSCTDHPE